MLDPDNPQYPVDDFIAQEERDFLDECIVLLYELKDSKRGPNADDEWVSYTTDYADAEVKHLLLYN